MPLPDKLQRAGLRGVESVSMRATVQNFIEETLRNPLAWVQRAGAAALMAFALQYHKAFNATFHGGVLQRFLEGLQPSKSPNDRRGACLGLGALPANILLAPGPLPPAVKFPPSLLPSASAVPAALGAAAAADDAAPSTAPTSFVTAVVAALVTATREVVGAAAEAQDAETRAEAARALTAVGLAVARGAVAPESAAVACEVGTSAAVALRAAADDYAVDRRGDVGSFVRAAALDGLLALALDFAPRAAAAPTQWSHPAQVAVLAFLHVAVKQGLDKLDRMRAFSGRALQRFATDTSEETIRAVFASEGTSAETTTKTTTLSDVLALLAVFRGAPRDADWSQPSVLFALLTPPVLGAAAATFSLSAAEGLCSSIGGLTQHVSRTALEAVRSVPNAANVWTSALVEMAARYVTDDRMTVPVLLAIERCLDGGIALDRPRALTALVHGCIAALRHYTRDLPRILPLMVALASAARALASTNATLVSPLRTRAWQHLVSMLASRYPKARATAALEVFTMISAVSDDLLPLALAPAPLAAAADEGASDATAPVTLDVAKAAVQTATVVLQTTQWDGSDVVLLRGGRDAVLDALRLPRVATAAAAAETTALEAQARIEAQQQRKRDELARYGALVRETGY
jgi:hypothetical protein